MKQIADRVALLRKFAVFEASGVVIKEVTRSETETSGSIDTEDGIAQKVNPYMSRRTKGRVTSTTTRYQTIHLKDEDGTRQVIDLVDFVVPCVEGDQVRFWGLGDDQWIAAENRSTGKRYRSMGGARQALHPRRGHILATALLVLLVLGLFTAGAGAGAALWVSPFVVVGAWFLLLVPAMIIGMIRARIAMGQVPKA